MASQTRSKEPGDFETFVREQFQTLGDSMQEMLTSQKKMERNLGKIEKRVKKNEESISDLADSLEFQSQRIIANEKSLESLKTSTANTSDQLQGAQNKIVTLEKEITKLERYTRGFNLRFLGIAETQNENCVTKLQNLLEEKLEFTGTVENAHRTGKPVPNHPRQIIARFHSRPARSYVISESRKRPGIPFRVVDDLTPTDLTEKKRVLPYMQKVYSEGRRPRFHHGRVYVGKNAATREVVNGYLATLPAGETVPETLNGVATAPPVPTIPPPVPTTPPHATRTDMVIGIS